MALSSDMKHIIVLLSIICMCIGIYIILCDGMNNVIPLIRKETFRDDEQNISSNLDLSTIDKKTLASTIIMFNPQQHLYAFTRNAYDMYISNEATLAWKSRFQDHLNSAFNSYLTNILSFPETIVLFSEKNFQGHIIYIPLSNEKKLPYAIEDPLIYKKYVRWEPPSKIISLIVPKGKKLTIYFQNDNIPKKSTTDGLVRELVLPDIIRTIEIDNNF